MRSSFLAKFHFLPGVNEILTYICAGKIIPTPPCREKYGSTMQPIVPHSSLPRSTRSHSLGMSSASKVAWILVGVGNVQSAHPMTVLHPTPFSVGRKPGCSLQINSKTVSSHHADFEVHDGQLILTDRASTNGTYVNGKRVTHAIYINEDDLIQFADIAFRVRRDDHATNARTVAEDVCDQALALVQFDRMMENRLVTPFFQPIVTMQTRELVGFEILARSQLFGLETSAAMFDAAARLNMEVELSHMLRWEGIREGMTLPNPKCLYVNTHPLELERNDLVESLAKLRTLSQNLPIVLEIHEAAVTNPKEMSELTRQIRDLNIGIAYDDFGAGQGRLAELGECPPDILKFDMCLLRNIDKASPERQKMLASLVSIVRDLGVQTLAEGVETEEEDEVCRQMGFDTAQGYLYGRPAPSRNYFDENA